METKSGLWVIEVWGWGGENGREVKGPGYKFKCYSMVQTRSHDHFYVATTQGL